MSYRSVLKSLESDAYRRAYSDGIIDLFVGISLLWIGLAWIWLPDFAGLAGVLPAVFVPVAMATRKRVVEGRVGYVKWSAPRRNKERRNLIGLLGAGVLLFLAGIAAFLVVDGSLVSEDVLESVMPGLLAWLLAILALGLAYAMEAWRFVAYAIALGIAGVVTAMQQANPGWPMLASGVLITITGLIMMIGFLRANPHPEE
jgi:hypothetical protein